MSSSSIHTSVLPAEVLAYLAIEPGMTVVDGTLGGGGHTRLMVEAVGPTGRVIALDRDPAAIERGARELAGKPIRFAQANFCDLPEVLDAVELKRVDRVLLDVGLSSDQLADHTRGFSFDSDGPLDLRFDPTEGEPAWRMINRLRPETLAMQGNRYAITEIGVENLAKRLVEVAEHDKQFGECEVNFFKDAKVNGRVCTCVQVVHPVPRRNFRFHLARVFIDDEYLIPIRYEAYDWPQEAGGQPVLMEEYTYMNVKINNGFTDADFDPKNAAYKFGTK